MAINELKLIRTKGYPFKAIKTAPKVFEKETRSWMWKSVLTLQNAVRIFTPLGAGPVHLRDSIMVNVRGKVANLRGKVFTSMLHGEVVETGSKPHMPPYYPIFYWVTRKLGVAISEARKVTRAIQWKIFHHGTEGSHMFEKGWKKTELRINAGFEQAAAKIKAFLEGGK